MKRRPSSLPPSQWCPPLRGLPCQLLPHLLAGGLDHVLTDAGAQVRGLLPDLAGPQAGTGGEAAPAGGQGGPGVRGVLLLRLRGDSVAKSCVFTALAWREVAGGERGRRGGCGMEEGMEERKRGRKRRGEKGNDLLWLVCILL